MREKCASGKSGRASNGLSGLTPRSIEHWATQEPKLRRYTKQPAVYGWQGAASNSGIDSSTGMDLIAEYDRGISRIKTWQSNC